MAKSKLEVATLVAMLCASITIAAAGVVSIIDRRPTPKPPRAVEVGDLFDEVPGIDFRANGSTLVLWVRSTCQFCTESMPLYAHLLSAERRTRIVGLGTESADTLRAYFNSHGVTPDQIVSMSTSVRGMPVTPIIVLVGEDRKVRARWKGKVESHGVEEQIVASIH